MIIDGNKFAVVIAPQEDSKGWTGDVDITIKYNENNTMSDSDKEAIINLMTLMTASVNLMEKDKSDFTLTFRYLSDLVGEVNNNSLFKQQFSSKNEIDCWLVKWQECLKKENNGVKEIKNLMLKTNPAFIPRNHQVEKAIYEAINNYDYSYMDRLVKLLNKPYNFQSDNLEYMEPPDNYDKNYQTFCGT